MIIGTNRYPIEMMQLPFRIQYLLAPATIILVLSGLVAYLLVELPNIKRENELTLQWEMATDRALVTVATAVRLEQLARNMSTSPANRDAHLFDYIEQTRIFLDTSQSQELWSKAPEDARRAIRQSVEILRDPERVDPFVARITLTELLPVLDQLSIDFQSKKRSAYIEYHTKLRVIVARLIDASLTVLLICIVLGASLTGWGLHVTRRRLDTLVQRAREVCTGNLTQTETLRPANDELGRLDTCLTAMTQRLVDVIPVEKVLQGAEEERRRIAMDMHDGVLADLTSLSRDLEQIDTADHPAIGRVRSGIADLSNTLRRTIDDLHPQILEILGLEAALRSFMQRHVEGLHCHFEFDASLEAALPATHKIHLFRIMTEAIHNVIRHAQSSRCEVSARMIGQQAIFTVEDNGIGMPPGSRAQGHGCLNIIERARVIGAEAHWQASRFSTGTRFELKLQLPDAA